MTDPLLSIVIVNFNYAAFLPQAIDSVLAQTVACEVIVVDDCSTDGSRAVIEAYGGQVTAVFRAANGGMSAAVNTGFAQSTGAIVLFLDADDFLYPDAARRVLDAWHDGVAQVQARLHLVDADGRVEDVFPPYEMPLASGDVTGGLRSRGRYATTVTTGLAFARSALDQVMPIPEQAFDRSADGYLATVVPLYGAVAAIDTPIGGYRRHGANHSGFAADMAKRARWRVEHDEHRYTALRDHAGRQGLAVDPSPGMGDATHLEQRLASLCFDRAAHGYAGDRRSRLGLAGARASMAGGMSWKRRATQAGMFLVAGFTPLFVARRALAWKLERSSRPKVIDWAAGRLRRLMG
ncbi:glycosyltransferase family 2 protein [Sphingomonas sp.]|uniref:glycosyltransferase family 2 protein n=1 Tax=Sphingomonas sp. TaxID=28214 RepID=UPI003CC60EDC